MSHQNYSLWRLIKADLDRFRYIDHRSYWVMPIMCPASLAVVTHRFGHAIWSYSGPLRPLMAVLKVVYMIVSRFIEIITGIWIAPQADIGPGLYISHFGTIIIGPIKMGANCNLATGVVIGQSARGKNKGRPSIGDRVFVGPGAKLIGNIRIGDDAAIGANAVVTRPIPERAVAVGIPAKVISYDGSFEYTIYEGMEADPKRQASLALRNIAPVTADVEQPIEMDLSILG